MASKTEKGDLVAVTTLGTVSVPRGAPMPDDEPGHKGAEINSGGTPFDPNAALRLQQGRGPGLQDSERLAPAHWQQSVADPVDTVEGVPRTRAGLERELEQAKTGKLDSVKDIEAELSRVKSLGAPEETPAA